MASLQGLFLVVSFVTVTFLYSSLYIIPSIIVLPFSINYSGVLIDYLFQVPLMGFFAVSLELY